MTIDTSQNVGVGTTSPGFKLTVAGTVNAAYVSGTSNLLIRNLSGVNRIDSYNDPITANYPLQILGSPVTFYTADTERMRIDSSGYLLVGTTSAGSYGQKQVISGGFGLTIAATFALTNSVQKISAGVGLLCYIRDTTNGHTALVIYENAQTPIIVSQTSAAKFITTGTPIGTQILLGNANQSPLNTAGIQASTASGAGITISVATISCQNS